MAPKVALTPEQQAQKALADNFNARRNLLMTGVKMSKPMQAVTGALGANLRIPLDRTGILTAVELHVSASVNVTGALTASPAGIYNLLRTVTYKDFASTERTKAPGSVLYAYNSIRHGHLFNQGASNLVNSNEGLLQIPSAINAAAPLYFVLRVPIAYSDEDLTGAVLAQTATGEHYLSIDLATALVGADPWLFPYTAGAATLNGSVTVTAIMEYIQPQNLAGLPILDLSTVYGIEGDMVTSDNLAVNQEKYINYPNMRSVLSALIAYDNGATAMNPSSDIDTVGVVANSNVHIMSPVTPKYPLRKQRDGLMGDLPASMLYFGNRNAPINTTLYGNVQIHFKPTSVGANSYVPYAFETKYPSGQPLPGIAQGA